MAIISSNIGDNDFSFRKKELRLVDSKNIPEEKRNNNLNLARPLNLKEFISEFIKFRETTVLKRVKFDLKKAEERAHILIGLATAVENIDAIIKIIKNSKNNDEAKKNLLSKKWKIKKSSKKLKVALSCQN